MFADEHAIPCGHPVLAAFGSHSCASLAPQVAAQLDAMVPCAWVTQHTMPVGQLAAPLHASAVVSAPPPPVGAGQLPA
jgi:hypothetical protein